MSAAGGGAVAAALGLALAAAVAMAAAVVAGRAAGAAERERVEDLCRWVGGEASHVGPTASCAMPDGTIRLAPRPGAGRTWDD